MPIESSWYLKGRVMSFRYTGVITLDELEVAVEETVAMLEEADVPLVHSLQNSKAMEKFPNNLNAVQKVIKPSLSHPRMGWMASFGNGDPITKYVTDIIFKVMRSRQRQFNSLEEALEFLNYVDSTLPDLKTLEPEGTNTWD